MRLEVSFPSVLTAPDRSTPPYERVRLHRFQYVNVAGSFILFSTTLAAAADVHSAKPPRLDYLVLHARPIARGTIFLLRTTNSSGDHYLQCDHGKGGGSTKDRRSRPLRLTDCPFSICARADKTGQLVGKIVVAVYNHPPCSAFWCPCPCR